MLTNTRLVDNVIIEKLVCQSGFDSHPNVILLMELIVIVLYTL